MKKILLILVVAFVFVQCSKDKKECAKKGQEQTVEQTATTSEEGKKAPSFRYADINGNYHKLEDFAGKLVYVDVWATWCKPCRKELPFLKEVKKEYKDKEIVFVGMSVDKDVEKWKAFVAKEQLPGVQIHAEGAWEADFVKAFGIEGIPRFILIGKDGNVISSDAPRPSWGQELRELLDASLQ